MHRRSGRDQSLVPFDPEIEATAADKAEQERDNYRLPWQKEILECYETMSCRKLPISPPPSLTRSSKQTISSCGLLLCPLWGRTNSVDVLRRTPHIHLRNFLAKYDTIKLNGVSADAVRLRLFPFSLTDRANDWLLNESLTPSPPGRPYRPHS